MLNCFGIAEPDKMLPHLLDCAISTIVSFRKRQDCFKWKDQDESLVTSLFTSRSKIYFSNIVTGKSIVYFSEREQNIITFKWTAFQRQRFFENLEWLDSLRTDQLVRSIERVGGAASARKGCNGAPLPNLFTCATPQLREPTNRLITRQTSHPTGALYFACIFCTCIARRNLFLLGFYELVCFTCKENLYCP